MLTVIFGSMQDGGCGLGPKDDEYRREGVKNRARLMEKFNLCARSLVTGTQPGELGCHTVTRADVENERRPNVDALVTDQPGITLGVLTADCMPLLLADEGKGIIAAVHMKRWMLLAGMPTMVVSRMVDMGADNIHAYLGPCLQAQSHILDCRTGENIMQDYPATDMFMEDARNERGEEAYSFDFSGYAVHMLLRNGVEIARRSDTDTYSSPVHFSMRRRIKDGNRGLNLSAISLRAR